LKVVTEGNDTLIEETKYWCRQHI